MLVDNKIEVCEVPHNIENEQQILGSIILNDKLVKEITDTVTYKMFYEPIHQKIFKAMMYLYLNHIGIGYETLLDRLRIEIGKKMNDEEVVDYLIKLSGSIASISQFEARTSNLIDTFRKRELYGLSKTMITTSIEGIASADLVKQIEDKIDGMGITSNIELTNFKDYIEDWVSDQEDETPPIQYKTGFTLLDEKVMIEKGEFIIIGARPAVGKSSFAVNIVKNFCLQGFKPLFISREMTEKQYMDKLMSNMSKVEYIKFKKKQHKDNDEWARIMSAKQQIKDFDFSFEHKFVTTIEQLEGLAKYHKKKDNLDIIIIDYLQLLSTYQYKGQKQNQVSYISQRLKQLAKELEVPVIALSQLNRGVVSNGEVRQPQLSDLRDSGSLEQDAGVVIMLHTDDVDQKHEERRFIKLFIRKNRYGVLGKIDYTYYGDYSNFVEMEWVDGRAVPVDQEVLTKNKHFTEDLTNSELDDLFT